MVEQLRNEYEPSEVSAPGETLREVLSERSMTQAELAARMGRPKKTISEIINAKAAITPDTALQLELVLGVPASFWNAREAHYREYQALTELRKKLAREVQWCRRFPVRHMTKLGWIRRHTEKMHQAQELLEFFGVATSRQWAEMYGSCRVAFRRSTAFEADDHALSAWLRAGEVEAEDIETEPFDRERFLKCLKSARGLTREAPEIFQGELVRECSSAGVAVAFIPEVPGSRASGATRWLSPDKALLQLSLRYRTDDHLWFTFFHEAAHILLHGKRLIFIESSVKSASPAEEAANRWAADFLIPPEAFEELKSWGVYSKAALVEFADDLGIAPGIVVGRLQHEGLLAHTHCNDLKQRFAWARANE